MGIDQGITNQNPIFMVYENLFLTKDDASYTIGSCGDIFTVKLSDILVPVRTEVDFCPNIPYELLTPNHLLYDLLYNPNETLFMKKGQAQGAVTKNGLEMLLLQAFAAWEIWNK